MATPVVSGRAWSPNSRHVTKPLQEPSKYYSAAPIVWGYAPNKESLSYLFNSTCAIYGPPYSSYIVLKDQNHVWLVELGHQWAGRLYHEIGLGPGIVLINFMLGFC
jgi:hypothetical protein